MVDILESTDLFLGEIMTLHKRKGLPKISNREIALCICFFWLILLLVIGKIKSDVAKGNIVRTWIEECVLEHKYARSTCKIMHKHRGKDDGHTGEYRPVPRRDDGS